MRTWHDSSIVALNVQVLALQRVEAQLAVMLAQIESERLDSDALDEAVQRLVDIESVLPRVLLFMASGPNDSPELRSDVEQLRENAVQSAATMIAQAESRDERRARVAAALEAAKRELDALADGLARPDRIALARRRSEMAL